MYICKICNKEFISNRSLIMHYKSFHKNLTIKEIYDTYYKQPNENVCNCNKETTFTGFGYKKYCSRSCASKETIKISQQKLFEKYGVTNPSQIPGVSNKVKQTKESRYGNPNYNNFEQYKETCENRYGVNNTFKVDKFKEKIKETNQLNNGVDYPMQSEKIKEKSKETCRIKYQQNYYSQTDDWKEKTEATKIKHWGCSHEMKNKEYKRKWLQDIVNKHNDGVMVKSTSQIPYVRNLINIANIKKYGAISPFGNKEIYEKTRTTSIIKYGCRHALQNLETFKIQQINAFKLKQYKETSLYYRGNNELDFLENFYEKCELLNGMTIRYTLNNKNKIYYPDFYLKSKNLIIEIKSCYTYQCDLEKNLAKQQACIEQGFNFIFIVDKDYTEFEKLI